MLDLSKLRAVHRRKRSRGELFLADWFEKNRPTDADIKKFVKLCERYRTDADVKKLTQWCKRRNDDPENDESGPFDNVLEAVNDILYVIPDGVDHYWRNRIRDMLRDVDLKRIRKCPSCGRWLYALDPRRKHCTPKCRDRVRMNAPSYRERKKEGMRNLRRIKKERLEKLRAIEKERREKGRALRK
jgi:hypothetical protein